ncbi:hypothetical protein HK104_008046 [Borealophlyctis nickersoniae]|nr:hypothetical protein HK104_008046 [Borealophlyctis nickersoniae]
MVILEVVKDMVRTAGHQTARTQCPEVDHSTLKQSAAPVVGSVDDTGLGRDTETRMPAAGIAALADTDPVADTGFDRTAAGRTNPEGRKSAVLVGKYLQVEMVVDNHPVSDMHFLVDRNSREDMRCLGNTNSAVVDMHLGHKDLAVGMNSIVVDSHWPLHRGDSILVEAVGTVRVGGNVERADKHGRFDGVLVRFYDGILCDNRVLCAHDAAIGVAGSYLFPMMAAAAVAERHLSLEAAAAEVVVGFRLSSQEEEAVVPSCPEEEACCLSFQEAEAVVPSCREAGDTACCPSSLGKVDGIPIVAESVRIQLASLGVLGAKEVSDFWEETVFCENHTNSIYLFALTIHLADALGTVAGIGSAAGEEALKWRR